MDSGACGVSLVGGLMDTSKLASLAYDDLLSKRGRLVQPLSCAHVTTRPQHGKRPLQGHDAQDTNEGSASPRQSRRMASRGERAGSGAEHGDGTFVWRYSTSKTFAKPKNGSPNSWLNGRLTRRYFWPLLILRLALTCREGSGMCRRPSEQLARGGAAQSGESRN